MRKILSSSKCIFIALIITVTFYVIMISSKQYEYDIEKQSNLMRQVEKSFNEILDNLYFSMEIVEQITINHHDELNQDILDSMFKPITEAFGYKSIVILPDGVAKYAYPLQGNEKLIGYNIFEMPNRALEIETTIDTKEVTMSGPYELPQGGTGFVMRKAVFLQDKLWGFVSVVIDQEELLDQTNLKVLATENYEYQFLAKVNNEDSKVIEKSQGFDKENARWSRVELTNGYWELGVEEHDHSRYNLLFAIILIVGYIIAFIIGHSVNNIEKKLKYAKQEVFVDKLTGANNRKYLEEIQKSLVKNNCPYTVVYIDLNEFKFINDTYGHSFGDEVLIFFTNKVKSVIRDTDYIVRMGGDEFVVILPNICNYADIERFCERLKKIELATIKVGEVKRQIKFTYGYDTCVNNDKILSQVICNADRNMYVVKHEKKSDRNIKPIRKMIELVTE